MTPKHDVCQQKSLLEKNGKTRLGYPVTCLKFYANKEDAKSDHQKMLAATCMSYEIIFSFIHGCSPIDTAGYVKVWHYPTQQCVYTFDEKERQPLTLDFNSNFQSLFVAG